MLAVTRCWLSGAAAFRSMSIRTGPRQGCCSRDCQNDAREQEPIKGEYPAQDRTGIWCLLLQLSGHPGLVDGAKSERTGRKQEFRDQELSVWLSHEGFE